MNPQASSFIRYRLHAVGLAVIGATLGAPGPARAQWAQDWAQDWAQNAYIGGNLGVTKNHLDREPDVTPPIPLFSTGRDNSDKGGKAYLGYQFHPNFAVEGGYFQLGHFTYNYEDPPGTGTIRGRSRYRGLNLDLVGNVPFGDFSIFGRFGAAYTDARTRIRTAGTLSGGGLVKERAWGPKIGIGLEYAFTPQLSVRGEIERYRVKDEVRGRGHIDMASLGLVYRFGGPAPAPTPVVAPPPPPPPAMAPPPPPPPMAPPPPPPPPPPAPAPLPPRPYRN